MLTVLKKVEFESQAVSAHLISLRIVQGIVGLRASELLLADALDTQVLSFGELVELNEEGTKEVLRVRLSVRDGRGHTIP